MWPVIMGHIQSPANAKPTKLEANSESCPGSKTGRSGKNFGKLHAPLRDFDFFPPKMEYNPNISVPWIYPGDL